MKNIIRKIDSLPPLEQTVLEVLEFHNSENKTPHKLIEIIEKDPLITVTLLKIINSSLFGFRNKVESIENLVYLLGVSFTTSLIIGNAIQSKFDIDFSPYGIDEKHFRDVSYLTTNFLNVWLKADNALKNELMLPVFLIDIGKYILAIELKKRGLEERFLEQITLEPENIFSIEKDFFQFSSLEVTILLLKHWKMSDSIINHMRYLNDIDNVPKEYLKSAQVIYVVKTICNIIEPLSDKFIALGLQKAEEFGLDCNTLLNTIETLKNRQE